MEPEFHVAALAFPFSSHAIALLELVKLLSEAAPNVTFSFLSTATSNAALFKEPSQLVGNIRPFNVFDGIPKGHVFSGGVQYEDVQLFLAATPGNFSEAIRVAEAETGRRVVCLITDTFLWFCSDLAMEMGVPWIPYWMSAASHLSIIFRMHLIRELVGIDGKNGKKGESEPLKFIPGMNKVEIDDLPHEILQSDHLNTVFAELLQGTALNLSKSAAVVCNSFEELQPAVTLDLKSNLKKFLCIGPTKLVSPPRHSLSDVGESCLRWLDNWGPTSVVYIAFGSIAILPPEEILALAEALEDLQFPFLWSIKDDFMRFLPDGFVERIKETGKLVSWAPQVQVLKQGSVGAFVTHGGWNSVSEGIVGMVPMICRPFFGDQSMNSRLVERVWEIGVKIPKGRITKSGAMGTLKRVLSLKDSREMRRNIRHLRDKAIKAFEPYGSSSANFKTLVEIITNDEN